jgi:hypothetical protein
MTKHSSIIGGSTAARLLNCPGSFQAIQALPVQIETPSEYAEYGTSMHSVMDHLFVTFSDGLPDIDTVYAAAEELIGDYFHDRELTREHVDESIIPALRDLYDVMAIYGGDFRVGATELRVKFPGIAGGFGTSDLLLISKTHALLVDWKFGAGVAVKAVYPDADLGDIVNAQILFYLTAAIATAPKLFTKRKLVGCIIQPRVQTGETCSHTEITRKEIKNFQEDVENAIIAALDRDPPLHKGDWCRWCPAKPACPKWTGPLLDLTAIGRPPALPVPADSDDGSYGQYLAKAKALLDHAADLKKEVDAAMHAYLEQGGTIPGWKLKLKTKLRQWADTTTVVPALTQLGFDEEDIWTSKLVTFKEADATAKRLGVKIPDHLRVAPTATETTVAPADDPAPAVNRALATEQFRAALAHLRKQAVTDPARDNPVPSK